MSGYVDIWSLTIPVAQSAKMTGVCGLSGSGMKQPLGSTPAERLEDKTLGIASGPFDMGVVGEALMIGFARMRRRIAGFMFER